MASNGIMAISPEADALRTKLRKFCTEEVKPAQEAFHEQLASLVGQERWTVSHAALDKLKERAKSLGLWNLFLPKDYLPLGAGLSNLDYAYLAEVMGYTGEWGSEACNCSAPDTGNMEVFAKYGSEVQKEKWLKPLLNGEIRSVFFMTEPQVASSDARNITTFFTREQGSYVVNGRKWWSSGVMDPRCKIGIVMGRVRNPKTASTGSHDQQSMVLVPLDRDAKGQVITNGMTVHRALTVFGYDDAPHGHAEVSFENCRVPEENMVLGEGRGFEISQGRLGPGRIHHAMRTIGVAELAIEKMIERASQRVVFGKPIAEQGMFIEQLALSRMEIEQARLLTLHTAKKIDDLGAQGARKEISMIKVAVYRMGTTVVDRALHVHGGGGVSGDFGLARMYANLRALRFADGPDEVHMETITKLELRNMMKKKEEMARL